MIINDNFQNFKRYGIPKAQFIIADIPFNLGENAYASNPKWYKEGDNANGESEFAKKTFFKRDNKFNSAEFMHFASKMLKKEPKQKKDPNNKKRQKSGAPCMLVFCNFDQQQGLIELGKKYGLNKYINLVFRKNYSPQVLKANMKIVGCAEYGIIFYRDRLPKFNNNGKMIMNVIDWIKRDKNTEPKLHETQKPVKLIEKMIKIFTDEGDVIIDPCCGSGSSLVAADNLKRKGYGFEIDKKAYIPAKTWIETVKLRNEEILKYGFAKTELKKIYPTLF